MARAEADAATPFLPPKVTSSNHHDLPGEDEDHEQPFMIVPVRPTRRHLRICICCICCCNRQVIAITLASLLAACLLLWLLWPSHPELSVVHVQLDHANISRAETGVVFVDTSMGIRVKIQNRDFAAHAYSLLSILVGYRGRWLGSITAGAPAVSARSTAYLDAAVKLNGTQPFVSAGGDGDGDEDVVVPLEIVMEIGARFHFFSINVPIEGMASCTVKVDVEKQAITSQDCYADASAADASA